VGDFKITVNSEITFQSKSGLSILESAIAEEKTLPYSCKTGRCSTCKCRLIQGNTKLIADELGLTDQEKGEGWILSCVRMAESDISIEVDDFSDIKLPVPKILPCRISEMQFLGCDVLVVKLRLPPSSNFFFIPGQYIEVIGPGGVRRSYSIAGFYHDQKIIELHIKKFENGKMSNYWFGEAKVNDLLRLYGPLGTFFLRNDEAVDLIFLATGTGIAPVKAILESLVNLPKEKKPNSITVLWGGRRESDLYAQLPVTDLHCTYIPVLSRAQEGWNGKRGYVQDVLVSMNLDLSKCYVYACGSDSMIRSAKDLLIKNKLPPRNFFSDAFVCSGLD